MGLVRQCAELLMSKCNIYIVINITVGVNELCLVVIIRSLSSTEEWTICFNVRSTDS
jgi:hypothetical protein